jgi:hypothetical protein
VGGDVLRGLDLAQQLGSIAADAASVDLDDLDLARRVNDEGAALGQSGFLDHHAEVARNGAGRVTDHRVLDLADGL